MVNPKISKALLGAAWVLVGFDAAKKVWRNAPIKKSRNSAENEAEKSGAEKMRASSLDSFSKDKSPPL